MRRLVLVFAVVGGAVSLAVVVLYGVLRGDWLEGLLAGIAVGMSMLPEEFPMVLAVFMAMGAWRISKARVLTRRASAIETLGAASVLCTDKTGTLTENRMTMAELRLPDGTAHRDDGATALPDAFRELAAAGVMASAPEPFDPMEKAFHAWLRAMCRRMSPCRARSRLLRSYPVDAGSAGDVAGLGNGGGRALLRIAAKGAPEAIADLCRLDAAARADAGGAGRRRWHAQVCGCWAWPRPDSRRRPARRRSADSRFGSWAWSDLPIRCAPSVPAAVAECRGGGHPGDHDHRRLSRHGAGHRRARPGCRATGSSPAPSLRR